VAQVLKSAYAASRENEADFRIATLVFWIKHLSPGEGQQMLVNPEHNQRAASVPG
jgi:hypothetical protein